MPRQVIVPSSPSARWALLYVRDALGLKVAPGYPPCVPRTPDGVALRAPELGDEAIFVDLWEAVGLADADAPPEAVLAKFATFTSAVDRPTLRKWIIGRKRGMEAVAEQLPHNPEWELHAQLESAGISAITVYPVAGAIASVRDGELIVSYETYVDLGAIRKFLDKANGQAAPDN